MNIVEEGLCLIREFDDKTDELLKYEEQEKQKVNELFAKAYIELIKKACSEAKRFYEIYNITIEKIKIAEYINKDNMTTIDCIIAKGSLQICINFKNSSQGKFSGKEYQKYYSTEKINELLNDVGIDVISEGTCITITFDRERVKVNKSSESEQRVQEPSGSARTLQNRNIN